MAVPLVSFKTQQAKCGISAHTFIPRYRPGLYSTTFNSDCYTVQHVLWTLATNFLLFFNLTINQSYKLTVYYLFVKLIGELKKVCLQHHLGWQGYNLSFSPRPQGAYTEHSTGNRVESCFLGRCLTTHTVCCLSESAHGYGCVSLELVSHAQHHVYVCMLCLSVCLFILIPLIKARHSFYLPVDAGAAKDSVDDVSAPQTILSVKLLWVIYFDSNKC